MPYFNLKPLSQTVCLLKKMHLHFPIPLETTTYVTYMAYLRLFSQTTNKTFKKGDEFHQTGFKN